MPVSKIRPEDTYEAFALDAPLKTVAKRLGLTANTLRSWWALRIADTFTSSLAELSADEQKQVKLTVYDLLVDPSAPGLRLHRLEHAKDKGFWSARVNDGIRIIVHKRKTNTLLCYTGHHEDSYAWAERRKLEEHPETGAITFIEV